MRHFATENGLPFCEKYDRLGSFAVTGNKSEVTCEECKARIGTIPLEPLEPRAERFPDPEQPSDA